MSVIVDLSIPADGFALGRLIGAGSGIRARLESMVPTDGAPIPYFWVDTRDAPAVEAALRTSDIVDGFEAVDEVDGETLFRVDWTADVDGFIASINDADAAVLRGEGHGDHWSFQLRFPGHDALSTFYRDAVDKGASIDIESVYDPNESTPAGGFRLTPEQREALSTALEAGYFAVPREATLVELAEELGISDTATSQRIRRGLSAVLSTLLYDD